MWPWEHAIVGYLVYSLFVRIVYRDSPGGLEAFAVVFASVLPDLIDKPLAWEFGVFESGYALGHSIFLAVPLAIFVGVAARETGRPRSGIAFGLGYLLHLPGDVLDGYARGGIVQFKLMLWPIAPVDTPATEPVPGFTETFTRFFGGYRVELLAGDFSTYRRLQIGLAAFVFVLWLADGVPVLRETLLGGKRLAGAVRDRVTGPPGESEQHR